MPRSQTDDRRSPDVSCGGWHETNSVRERAVRLVRNIFYVSGAIIGAGVLLYFVAGIASALYFGMIPIGRSSLPGPVHLSKGNTYNVTPDCPMTIVAITGTFPDRLVAMIRSRDMGRDYDLYYGIGKSVDCGTSSGENIKAVVKSIDLDSVHFTFEWSH